MDRITVTCISNPFDPLADGARETRAFAPGASVGGMIEEMAAGIGDAYDVAVSIDGEIIPYWTALDIYPLAGQSVVFCAVPKGSGSDGKEIGRMVAMIAIMIVSIYTGQVYGAQFGASIGLSSAAGTTIVQSAVMIAGSLIINSVFQPSIPDAASFGNDNISSSPTYGWEAKGNAVTEGGVVPILYGTHRVVPPLIGKYIEVSGDSQYLNLLFCVADHAVDAVTDIRINDNPVEYYAGVTVETRLGSDSQTVIPYFADTRTDVGVSAKLSSEWVTRETEGNTVEGLAIGLLMPRGLFYANAKGELEAFSIQIDIEIRRKGDAAWTRVQEYNLTEVTVTTPRWSAGYWQGRQYAYYTKEGVQVEYPESLSAWQLQGFIQAVSVPGTWIEIAQGSTAPADHTEGDAYRQPGETWSDIDAPRVAYAWRWREDAAETVMAPGTVLNDYVTITGARAETIRKTYTRDDLTAGAYEIRVKHHGITPQSGTRYGCDAYFEYFTESVYDDFAYPGTALLAVRALATDQLSGSMPTVSCKVARATVPVWTGAAYENKSAANPAWACWDILHDGAYGGAVDRDRIVYADFSVWAAWCDAQGYTCNLYLDSVMSLRKALDAVGPLGRAAVIQMGSKFTCIVDKPEDLPVQRFLFTAGNIVADSFSEEWLPLEDRANVIEVTYFDAELDYERQIVEVRAGDYGTVSQEVKKTAITLYGCTSRTQALYYGKYLLNGNRYLCLTAGWDADVDALACMPGDVVEVAHDVPQWGYSGRVVAAAANSVTLDRSVTMEAGTSYVITIQHLDDDTRETLSVTTVPGTTAVLALPVAWSSIPAKYALYSFGETDRVSKLFRVSRITRSQDLRRRVTAIEHVPEVYIDGVDIPAPETASDLAPVRVLMANEIVTPAPDGSIVSTVCVSWIGAALSYDVHYRVQGTPAWSLVAHTDRTSCDIPGLAAGVTYDIAVVPGGSSPEGTPYVTITPTGQPAWEVPAPTGLAYSMTDGALTLAWDAAADISIIGYDVALDGTVIVSAYAGNRYTYDGALSEGEYAFTVAAVDTLGRRSDPASLTLVVSAAGDVSVTTPTETRFSATYTKTGSTVTLSWTALSDPQISAYHIFQAAAGGSFGTATKLGETTGTGYTFTLDRACPRIFICPWYTSGEYSRYPAMLDIAILGSISSVGITINEPIVTFRWDRIAGASTYEYYFDVGGLCWQWERTTIPAVSFQIPKYSAELHVRAIAADGEVSDWFVEEFNAVGVYRQNEVAAVTIPSFTGGKFINMAWVTGDTVQRPSLLGGTVAAPYGADVNDSDLFNIAKNLAAAPASGFATTPASWFRGRWWNEDQAYFESPVYDLGAACSGNLNLSLTKTVTNYALTAANIEDYTADYFGNRTVAELINDAVHMSADVEISTDQITWTPVAVGDYVTARYFRLRVQVLLASPMTQIDITAGRITLDMPDLSETGTVALAGTYQAVTFTKSFTAVTYVVCNAAGAAQAWPQSVSSAGFTIYCSAPGQTVTWFAKGY